MSIHNDCCVKKSTPPCGSTPPYQWSPTDQLIRKVEVLHDKFIEADKKCCSVLKKQFSDLYDQGAQIVSAVARVIILALGKAATGCRFCYNKVSAACDSDRSAVISAYCLGILFHTTLSRKISDVDFNIERPDTTDSAASGTIPGTTPSTTIPSTTPSTTIPSTTPSTTIPGMTPAYKKVVTNRGINTPYKPPHIAVSVLLTPILTVPYIFLYKTPLAVIKYLVLKPLMFVAFLVSKTSIAIFKCIKWVYAKIEERPVLKKVIVGLINMAIATTVINVMASFFPPIAFLNFLIFPAVIQKFRASNLIFLVMWASILLVGSIELTLRLAASLITLPATYALKGRVAGNTSARQLKRFAKTNLLTQSVIVPYLTWNFITSYAKARSITIRVTGSIFPLLWGALSYAVKSYFHDKPKQKDLNRPTGNLQGTITQETALAAQAQFISGVLPQAQVMQAPREGEGFLDRVKRGMDMQQSRMGGGSK